ncbi:hypothetical protein VTN00DRAFT_5050 [Thermoascus crustaceus]|uniref:uncharacterized protein n=1 Tax=Thermoascus crustaceus TaxID=5088 RepID=UPI00374465B7
MGTMDEIDSCPRYGATSQLPCSQPLRRRNPLSLRVNSDFNILDLVSRKLCSLKRPVNFQGRVSHKMRAALCPGMVSNTNPQRWAKEQAKRWRDTKWQGAVEQFIEAAISKAPNSGPRSIPSCLVPIWIAPGALVGRKDRLFRDSPAMPLETPGTRASNQG